MKTWYKNIKSFWCEMFRTLIYMVAELALDAASMSCEMFGFPKASQMIDDLSFKVWLKGMKE